MISVKPKLAEHRWCEGKTSVQPVMAIYDAGNAQDGENRGISTPKLAIHQNTEVWWGPCRLYIGTGEATDLKSRWCPSWLWAKIWCFVGFASEGNYRFIGFCPCRQLDICWLSPRTQFAICWLCLWKQFAVLLVLPRQLIRRGVLYSPRWQAF